MKRYNECIICGWGLTRANPISIEVGMCADCRIKHIKIPDYISDRQSIKFYKKHIEKYYEKMQ